MMPGLDYFVFTGLLVTLLVVCGSALELGKYEKVAISAGEYSVPFEVDLTNAKDYLGILRVDMTWQSGIISNYSRPTLFLSTKTKHSELGVGSQTWEESLSYEWSIASTGHVHISVCQDHDGKERTPGIHGNGGFLSEETASTMAYCLKPVQQLQEIDDSLSRLGPADWSVDAPSKECRCADTSGPEPKLYARVYCHALGDECNVNIRVSAICSHGKP